MSAVLDQLASKFTARLADHAAAYHALALEVLDGKSPDPGRVEQVLDAAGKTLADLRTAVDLLGRRRLLSGRAAAGKTAEAEAEKVRRQQSTLDAELEAARRKHEQASAVLGKRRHDLAVVAQHGTAASIELRNTAAPELVSRAGEASARLERRRGTLSALQAELVRLNVQLPRLRQEAVGVVEALESGRGLFSRNPESPAAARERYRRQVTTQEARLAALPALVREAEAELVEAEAEAARADAELLKAD